MKCLAFSGADEVCDGRRIRRAIFGERSSLPVSAACVAANAMRQTLATLSRTPVAVRLFEPVIPHDTAWRAIAANASVFHVSGPLLDAAIVIRSKDAITLAALLFGEAVDDDRDLSIVERTVVARAVEALAASLAPICGFRETPATEPILDIRGYSTYFEVLIEQPVRARIGIALSREPVPAVAAATLHPRDLLDVEVDVRVQLAEGWIDGAALLALGEGVRVPMTSKVGDDGVLLAGATVIARGECGAQGTRAAMIVRLPANGVLR